MSEQLKLTNEERKIWVNCVNARMTQGSNLDAALHDGDALVVSMRERGFFSVAPADIMRAVLVKIAGRFEGTEAGDMASAALDAVPEKAP